MIALDERAAPLPLKEVGLSEINQVGIAPDALGAPMICFSGGHKQLSLLSGLPGAQRWPCWDCLAYPLDRTNVLVTETIGRVEEATEAYVARRNELLAPPHHYAEEYPPSPDGEPAPFQHQIDSFCWAADTFARGLHGFGQFSEQGTGKSRWACDMLRRYARRAVVIGQNSTMPQWKDWLERICPEFEILMLTGCSLKERAALIESVASGQRLFNGPVVFLVNWEVIARLEKPLVRLRPDMVIADEATRIKERIAQMSKAAHRIAEVARYRIAMTGTPLGNDPGDLWSIYKFLEPSLFGKSYWNYMKSYFLLGGMTGYEFIGFNPMQIGSFIGRMYALAYRITKATIADMPEKNYEVVSLKMEGEQVHLYRQIENDLYAARTREDGTEESLSIPNALVQITRLQQIAAGLFPTDTEVGEKACCQPIESVKTRWLQQYCREQMESSDIQIIVWARFTAEIDAICKALEEVGLRRSRHYAVIDGRVKTIDRRSAQVLFNDRSHSLRILICQIQAAAFGFDLPSADVMVYHSLTFSFLERAQSVERGHRMGRTRPYQIIDLVCKNSVDVTILQALKKKQNLADMLLVEGFGSVLKTLTDLEIDCNAPRIANHNLAQPCSSVLSKAQRSGTERCIA